jgi:hypothetical protein
LRIPNLGPLICKRCDGIFNKKQYLFEALLPIFRSRLAESRPSLLTLVKEEYKLKQFKNIFDIWSEQGSFFI